MQTLRTGTASFYSETLHPTGAVKVPLINYVAHGTLDSDGRSFHVHALLVSERVTNVRVKFK